MRKASIVLIPCVVVGLAAVGCGGDDSSDSTSSQALTKTAYLKQGNEICKKQDAEIAAAANTTFGKSSPSKAELTKFANDTVIPGVEDEISQLRELPAPAGDEDTVNAIYDAADQGLAKLKANPTLITNGEEAFGKANKLAKDYGLVECAD